MAELVSFPLRYTFREYCVSYLSVRTLEDIFYGFGIEPGELDKSDASVLSNSRRSTVEKFYKAFDWLSIQDVQLFLKVLNHILDMPIRYSGYSIVEMSEEQRLDQQRILDLCVKDGFKVDGNQVSFQQEGVKGKVKNLIFAANGPKPEIVLADLVNSDIRIVENEEYCLVYDKPILDRGLLWTDLVEWWREQPGNQHLNDMFLENNFYHRLGSSLKDSPPEQLLFRTYMQNIRREFGKALPALLPQVYLHYDPYTIKQLAGNQSRLPRQRMDFLLLFSNHIRIVVEVDGQQHYAEGTKASPHLYAKMVAEDRQLRLAGYEIYRFGGYELSGEWGKKVVTDFFSALFQHHSVKK